MTKTIKVSIVDDEVDLRENIAGYVDSAKGFRCLGVHSSAEDALVNLPKEKPDVVLMDINLGWHERHRVRAPIKTADARRRRWSC